ncbi:PKD domain-containing protein, partial [candidate division WS5 bacterium]
MNRVFSLKFARLSLLILLIILVTITIAYAHPKDFTRLYEDPIDNTSLGNRTPLILIHGYRGNGNITDINWPYWETFRNFYYFWDTFGLKEKYKLYSFWYESDRPDGSIDEISKGLRDWIDERTNQSPSTAHKLDDVPFVIVAHSMGGLVSRAFMEKTLNIGSWTGSKGGERVMKLVTLATPHHGTNGANDSDLGGCLWGETDPIWWSTAQFGDFFVWRTIETNEPNRNDVLWDNYNNSMGNCNEVNGLLPFNGTFDNKIIAYGGILPADDPDRPDLFTFNIKCPLSLINGEHDFYLCTSVLLYEAMQEPWEYGENDGLVPILSSLYDGQLIDHHHLLEDFDHTQMKGGNLYPAPSSKYYELFNPLSDDLNSIVFGIDITPSKPYAPVEITFSPTGGFSAAATYIWEFHDGTIKYDKKPTFIYRSDGDYAVTMTVNDPTLGVITRERTISVYKPKIDISYPNGFEDLYRHFETQNNPLIESYVWDFGDGVVRNDDDNTTSHTYLTSGYYTVTLTLTLDDDTTIQSQKGIFVGPGTRYIQGHTIYDDEIWESGGTYVVQGNITVARGGSLTIESGVRVEIAGGSGITVYGTLTASEVTLTWVDGLNQWGIIQFREAGASNSRLENSVIEHAGNNIYNTVILIVNASPSITGNMIIDNKPGYGISIYNGSPLIHNNTISGQETGIYITNNSFPIITGNTITGNNYGINTYYSSNSPVISSNTYSNNATADLRVRAGTISTVVNWNETGAMVYEVDDSLTIAQGASLNITSGKTVKLISKESITVYGTLVASGVTFTWADGVNQWGGILFSGEGATNSRIENCTIEHAGGYTQKYYLNNKAYYNYFCGILRITGSSPTIIGSHINNDNSGVGICVEDGSPVISYNTISGVSSGIYIKSDSLSTVTGNIITGNRVGIHFGYSSNNPVISDNIFSNNSTADIGLGGTIYSAEHWDDSIVYGVSDLIIAEGGSLNIASGSTVKILDYRSEITVYGTLNANGVIFTSMYYEEYEEKWSGIKFEGAGSSGSILENCVIEHAVGAKVDNIYRGILSIVNSSPSIVGTTIINSSASSGIYIYNGSPAISDSTI